MCADNELRGYSGMREVWKDVVGYEGQYQVSNLGRVKSLSRVVHRLIRGKDTHYTRKERIMKQRISCGSGYMAVQLGGKKTVTVHRLVCRAFLGEPNGRTVNHKNSIRSDPRLTNLEYVSFRENIRHGKKRKIRGYQKTRNGKYIAQICVDRKRHFLGTYETPEEATKAYIRECKKRKFGMKYIK